MSLGVYERGVLGRIETLLTEIRDLLKAQRAPFEKGIQPDYRPTPPTGPAVSKFETSSGGYYRCPTCGSKEPIAYMECDYPGCPDGHRHDQYRR